MKRSLNCNGMRLRLIEDESQKTVLDAADLQGFFLPQGESSSSIRMMGVAADATLTQGRLHDIELQVLDARGEVIGAYYIGEVEIIRCSPSDMGDRAVVDASFLGYSCPFPRGREVWCRWASKAPRSRGEWRQLPQDWHPSWLHVVQTAWFQAGRMATRYNSESSYVVDGAGIASVASLFCEIGEAINGPGGYFGSSSTGLLDCLRSATANGAFELRWQNLNSTAEDVEVEARDAISLFQEFGVEVHLD